MTTRLISYLALVLNLLKDIFERSGISFNKFRTSAGNWIRQVSFAKYALSLVFLPLLGKTDPKLMLFKAADAGNNTKEITITFIVPEKDFIYKDFISCSIDEPTVILSAWKANKHSIEHYDPTFKETKHVFNETFSIAMTATTSSGSANPIHLYCSYYRKADKKINHALFSFSFTQPLETNIQVNNTNIEVYTEPTHQKLQSLHSSTDKLYAILTEQRKRITAFFIAHHKKCFSLLFIMISLLFLLFYFYQEWLRKYKNLHELVDVTITSCTTLCIAYVLMYIYIKHAPFVQLITIGASVLFSAIVGFLFIKKSTQLQSGSLRTFCTFIGMICIVCTLFLAFKILQYADEQFGLF